MTSSASRRAVIFDRDGVLNVDHGYVGQVDRLQWMAGARRAIRRLNDAAVLAIVATNQSGVARGFFSEADVRRVHDAMQTDLAQEGARIDAFYVCPFHHEAVDPAYAHRDHPERKPNPGMLLRAIADFGLDLGRTVMIGDQERDLEAARRAGIAGVLFSGGDLDAFVRSTPAVAALLTP
ncbi:MAG TPA: HAD family hydrolase [Caulobacteraceae bacterium]|nr:HAD family hydrolase [Caulobacteraceae bacterium]